MEKDTQRSADTIRECCCVFGKLCAGGPGLGRNSRHKGMSFNAPFLGNSNILLTVYHANRGCGLSQHACTWIYRHSLTRISWNSWCYCVTENLCLTPVITHKPMQSQSSTLLNGHFCNNKSCMILSVVYVILFKFCTPYTRNI